MIIHLSNENLEKYCRRTLPPRELLAADEHLATCERCRELAARSRADKNAFAALKADLHSEQFDLEHLAPEQMSAFVDDALDAADRGIVESHLTVCSMCFDEINDLREFSATLETKRPIISPGTVSPGFRDQLRDVLSGLASWSYPRLAGTAAAGLLLFVSMAALMFYVWKSTRSGPLEVATSQPTEEVRIPQPAPENTQPPVPSPVHSPSPIVVVSLEDGGQRLTLDEQGNLEGASSLLPATQRALKEALTTGRVRTPDELSDLERKSGVLMGNSSEGVAFPLVGPIGTIVRSDRPTFSWHPLPGAQRYTVTVLDSGFRLIASSPSLTATRWTVPGRLKRGDMYVWQVTAIKDGKEVISPIAPAPEARFKILEAAKVEQLRRVESGHPASHLARGISYAEAGLLGDAEREFRALLAGNPQSDAARKLLRSVEARRRPN